MIKYRIIICYEYYCNCQVSINPILFMYSVIIYFIKKASIFCQVFTLLFNQPYLKILYKFVPRLALIIKII